MDCQIDGSARGFRVGESRILPSCSEILLKRDLRYQQILRGLSNGRKETKYTGHLGR